MKALSRIAPHLFVCLAMIALICSALISCAPAHSQDAVQSAVEASDEMFTVEGEEAQSEDEIRTIEDQIRQEFAGAEDYSEIAQDDVATATGIDSRGVVPRAILNKALSYFNANKSRFSNQRYIAIVDYGQCSSRARFYVVNMSTGVATGYRVAHGTGSDQNNDCMAERFSNTEGSHASSIGYARTAETYVGKNGRSLRLDGLSSTNSGMRRRAVVIHGSDYVYASATKAGRSWGCPALPRRQAQAVIDQLKGGAFFYMSNGR
jgi:hypothetical protein